MNRLTVLAIGYSLLLTALIAWPKQEREVHTGIASWYGEKYRGRTTASGSVFNPDKLTAAHRTLPFGTVVRCVLGERSVDVTITDRGPFIDGRELDLSRAAFEKLAHTDAGLIKVKWKVMK